MGPFILPLAQAQSLEIILDSSFSHTPRPISQQSCWLHLQNRSRIWIASHHFLPPKCLAQATTLVHLDSCTASSSGPSLCLLLLL